MVREAVATDLVRAVPAVTGREAEPQTNPERAETAADITQATFPRLEREGRQQKLRQAPVETGRRFQGVRLRGKVQAAREVARLPDQPARGTLSAGKAGAARAELRSIQTPVDSGSTKVTRHRLREEARREPQLQRNKESA